ncbi:MAG: helicase HerA domain-containing protein [Promethearchaeati archaeon]
MSDNNDNDSPSKDEDIGGTEEKPVGRLTGKTELSSATLLIESKEVERTSYLTIYKDDKKAKKNEDTDYFILSISKIWNDSDGMKADLTVVGDRPKRPFEVGSKVYLAKEQQIRKLLGIDNPPEKSVALGKLLGYDFDVNLLIKDFGRVFITGRSGSGKSYTMGVLCEEFMEKGIPVVILDRHGEYGSLKIAGEDEGGAESEFIDNIIEFSDLSINKGADIDIEYLFSLDEKDIVAPNLCSIINMRGISLEAQETLAGRLLKKLYQASTSRKIPPFYLFLDEAHLFAGKKSSATSDTVRLFSQEGRKFGANLVIGTQRPQLLDTTIRAQAGTWVVHSLSDVNDINITISSAEDLSRDNRDDISGLDRGEGIISGEAVRGVPIFIKVRKRRTQHGGIGFNALDYLSEQTVEDLQKRKQRILGDKSESQIEAGKEMFKEILGDKTKDDLLDMISDMKMKIKELEEGITKWKERYEELEIQKAGAPSSVPVDERVKELQTEVKVWEEKYNSLKERVETGEGGSDMDQKTAQTLEQLEKYTKELEMEMDQLKIDYDDAIRLAEKSIKELKRVSK